MMTPAKPEWMPAWERPIRIPKRVPLLHAEPAFAFVGERSTWTLPFELAEDIEPDTTVKLQLSGGRNNKGGFDGIQVDRADDEGYLSMTAPAGEVLPLVDASPDGRTWQFTVPESGFRADEILTVTLHHAEAPRTRMLNKFFILYRDQGEAEPPRGSHPATYWNDLNAHLILAACRMHVLGGPIHHLRAYVPSQVRPNEPLDILVRPEDPWSNLSCRTLDDLSVFLEDDELPSSVEPVAESTCVRLRVSLPNEGVHRLLIKDRQNGMEVTTNPVVCSTTPPEHPVLWGMIHGHTEMSDGVGTLNYYFHQIRHEAALDFAGSSDHDNVWETPERLWQVTCETVARWNQPGVFTTFLGYEWAKWRKNGDGDRNVYYLDDHRPMYRSDDDHYPTPPDLFGALKDETAIVIPHHTGHAGNWCDWKDHDTKCERLVEIYQVRGSFETSEANGNPVPEQGGGEPVVEGYVERALAMGWRVGFTGGGDDHGGHAGTEFVSPGAQTGYRAGLMAVQAEGCTRKNIWSALWNRRVLATTGARMLLAWQFNGHPMGSELSAGNHAELLEARRITIEFHGTADAERIDIIRNGKVVKTFTDGGLDCNLLWEDTEPLKNVVLPPAKFCPDPFCFYYVRVTQTDNEVAWASPVWIDVSTP